MQRRPFLRILGGAAVLAATPALPGCSSALPAEALAAWQPPAPVPPGGRCAPLDPGARHPGTAFAQPAIVAGGLANAGRNLALL
jgi:hypothetical protein